MASSADPLAKTMGHKRDERLAELVEVLRGEGWLPSELYTLKDDEGESKDRRDAARLLLITYQWD